MSVTEPSSTTELPERSAPELATETSVAALPAPEPAPPLPEPVRARRWSLREWFWRSRALGEVRARLLAIPAADRARLQHARLASELADRALDPIDPLRAGPSVALSLSLYREAAYWALSAEAPESEAHDLALAFERAPAELLTYAAGGGGEELAAVRRALVEKDFVRTAAETPEVQRADALLASAFVHALIRHKLGSEQALGRLLVQRWLRTGVLLLVFAGAVVASVLVFGKFSLSPDLALGKPWRTSSTYAGCSIPQKTCGNTKIFFHTEEDQNPWVEFDLKKSRDIGRIEVVNRTDYGPELAIPLALEVSNDAKNWKQVARRDEPFIEWTAQFKRVKARYVRARVLKRAYFHLERVSIRER
jgi:hypothetical protein